MLGSGPRCLENSAYARGRSRTRHHDGHLGTLLLHAADERCLRHSVITAQLDDERRRATESDALNDGVASCAELEGVRRIGAAAGQEPGKRVVSARGYDD